MSATDSRKIYVDPSKVRKPDQLLEYERIFADGVCPFCLDHREEYTQGTRLYDGKHLWMFENNWPYKNTRRHIMSVAREHAVYLEDLPRGFGEELFEQYSKLEQTDKYDLAAIEARFGFVMWTGASVAHFHTHLLIPEDPLKDTFVEEHELGEALWSGKEWTVFDAANPHVISREHKLIVSNSHASTLAELKAGAGEELFEHFKKIESVYDFTHGGFHCRIGKRKQAGVTKNKLTFEFLCPDDSVYDDESKKLRMQISELPAVDFKIST